VVSGHSLVYPSCLLIKFNTKFHQQSAEHTFARTHDIVHLKNIFGKLFLADVKEMIDLRTDVKLMFQTVQTEFQPRALRCPSPVEESSVRDPVTSKLDFFSNENERRTTEIKNSG